MTDPSIYTVGGTVQAGGGVYIKRKADDELLELCRQGEFAFILSSRQVGKSSLMTNTAEQLRIEGTHSAIVDLSSIGAKITQDEWYLGILDEVANQLNLEADIFDWWELYSGLGPSQRFYNFLRDIVLKEIKGKVVLFFDEIDTTLSIPFADDFFASLRATYNARSTTLDFRRLSFVMVGVATPSDLISDEKRTPFNIGQRVELTDFTPWEALPLAGDLGADVLEWVFFWTGGHPYLTQRLCAYLSKNNEGITEEYVASAVKSLFEGEQGRQDNNLQFVRDMLIRRAPDIQRVLKTYRDIRLGKKVTDDEHSVPKAHLKISGVVHRKDGMLQLRNRIYERAFDLTWVDENTPQATTRKLTVIFSLITTVALIFAGYFYYRQRTLASDVLAKTYTDNFNTSNSQEVKITSLAALFGLGDKYALQARDLFDALDHNQQLDLFNLTSPTNVGNELVIVVDGVYQYAENSSEGNALLQGMVDVLGQTVAPGVTNLILEINSWLDGRSAGDRDEYALAIGLFTRAFEYSQDRKHENAAILIDRAAAYTTFQQYDDSLTDYSHAIEIDINRADEIESDILGSQLLVNYLQENLSDYPNLSKLVSIPTSEAVVAQLPTPTPTPTQKFEIGSTMTGKDGMTLLYVPAGEFPMGSEDGHDDEKPVHTVSLDAFWIDETEVTNGMYALCVNVGVCELPLIPISYSRGSYYYDSGFGNYPVIYVSWHDANTYCSWVDRRLPTEAEWEKAASWDEINQQKHIYPWGDSVDCSFANYYDGSKYCVGDTTEVGSYPEGASPYGALDMAGNAEEWVNDKYGENYYQSSPSSNPQGPLSGEDRVTRGGSWDLYGDVRTVNRFWAPPTIESRDWGFRCAMSASE